MMIPEKTIKPSSITVPFPFDFQQPDYHAVFKWRVEFLLRIRKAGSAEKLKAFYRDNPIQFIIDWGVTFEPRNPEIGLPTKIPFVLFPLQIEWAQWVLDRWRARERGMTLKSRGSGMSWLAVSLAATLCLFNKDLVIGFGSRKAEYVDQIGDPKSLFFKARMFLENLPPEFRCGWNSDENSRQMRIFFPHSGSAMTGESGDGIGRGDRTSIYVVDESGFLEHPEMAEASLSDTTNCRIDISTSPGSGTVFADRYEVLPERQRFFFHWRSDPRRGLEWHKKKLAETPQAIFDREYEGSLDDYGEFFTEAMLLVDGKPVAMPDVLEGVYAVIDTANKSGLEHDGLAVIYVGIRPDDVNESKLVVLGWDITQINANFLIDWLPGVFAQLEEFAKKCHALQGSLGAWIEDKTSGIVLIQQAQNLELNVHAIDSKLTSLGKAERAINVSRYVHTGQVKVAREAWEHVVTYKGVTKNHLASQILGFRAGVKDLKQDDLLDVFTYSVAIGTGNSEGF